MIDRRSFMTNVGLLATGLAFSPEFAKATATKIPALDPSIVDPAVKTMKIAALAAQDKKLTPVDVMDAASKLEILSYHMARTGWNAEMTPIFHLDIQESIEYRSNLAPSLQKILEANGIRYNASNLVNRSGVKEQTLSYLNKPGLTTMEQFQWEKLRAVAYKTQHIGIINPEVGVGPGCDYLSAFTGVLAIFSPPPIDALWGAASFLYTIMALAQWC